jgi:hypothetical protein
MAANCMFYALFTKVIKKGIFDGWILSMTVSLY